MTSVRMYKTAPVGYSPPPISRQASLSMRSNKRSGTQPELLLAKALRKRIISNELPGRPDFIYPKQKVAVFVNGCFWHRCPVCDLSLPKAHRDFWKRKFDRNVERDRLNKAELESLGWRSVEVWEHEVKQNPQEVSQRIKALVAAPFK